MLARRVGTLARQAALRASARVVAAQRRSFAGGFNAHAPQTHVGHAQLGPFERFTRIRMQGGVLSKVNLLRAAGDVGSLRRWSRVWCIALVPRSHLCR